MQKNQFPSLTTMQWRSLRRAGCNQQESEDLKTLFCSLSKRNQKHSAAILPIMAETDVNETETVQVTVNIHLPMKDIEQEKPDDGEDRVEDHRARAAGSSRDSIRERLFII